MVIAASKWFVLVITHMHARTHTHTHSCTHSLRVELDGAMATAGMSEPVGCIKNYHQKRHGPVHDYNAEYLNGVIRTFGNIYLE